MNDVALMNGWSWLLSCAAAIGLGPGALAEPAAEKEEDFGEKAAEAAAQAASGVTPEPTFPKPFWDKAPGEIRKLEGDVYAIGEVRVERSTRCVRVPVEVNMVEGAVEYFLCAPYGKVHECVLRTEVIPLEIHLAVLLLGRPGQIPESLPDGNMELSEQCPVELAVEFPAAAYEGKQAPGDSSRGVRLLPAGRLVLNVEAGMPLADDIWMYTSSSMHETIFVAQRNGTVAAIMEDTTALVNMRGPLRERDDLWAPNTAELPPVGTKGTLVLRIPEQAKAGEAPEGAPEDGAR